jgi:endonuclease/exonuclease/phosphatase (EEP) superfamily protein YafD
MKWLRAFVAGACALPVAGTLLSLNRRRTHWIFRMWDFPRVQIATIAAAGALAYRARFFRGRPAERALLAADATVIAWQLFRIRRYTPLWKPTVLRATEVDEDNRIVLLMTNVLQTNRQYGRLLEVVERANPDLILAVEIDQPWMEALAPLDERYPHAVRVPLDNLYGMLLLSRLELIGPRVDYRVQDDIPSIHTRVRLRSGAEVVLHGLHPRPPEPIHDQSSGPRDEELVLAGRAIAEGPEEPTIVAGDLNDVAWSPTSELFVRLSGLLDPRVGRGFYNSSHAHNPLFRYPLDHVFHSTHFKLVRLERLPDIGSDHFPILVELQCDRTAVREQQPSEEKPGDEELAAEKLKR